MRLVGRVVVTPSPRPALLALALVSTLANLLARAPAQAPRKGDAPATAPDAPRLAASPIHLSVRDALDQAVATASVTLLDAAGRELRRGATDAVVQVVGLPRGDALQVVIDDADATWVTKRERRFADATRLPDQDLEITLSGPEGQPLGGVEVRFVFNSERELVARSDPAGRVRIRSPTCLVQIRPGGPEWLFALPERPGMFDRDDRVHHLPNGAPLQLHLVPTLEIRGRVLDWSRQPLARAPVFVREAAGTPRRLLSDGSGAFSVRVPARRERETLAVWIGQSPTAEVTLDAHEASRAGVTLTAEPHRYELEVVDSAGAPCPGERLGIPLHGANPLAMLREAEFFTTDRQGRARRTLFGRVETVIHASGSASVTEMKGAPGERRLRISLQR